MDFIADFIGNKIFIASFFSWIIAQLLKAIIHTLLSKKFVPERLVGSGGMPSSHSSTVCALATSTGILYGGGSFEFAMAIVFAIVIMHDAIGVRREAGNHAKILNELMERLLHPDTNITPQERLKEFVGHTPLQVFAGAILGILIAVVICL
ncbi:MAG: divergent PAP2 family protein [Eubacteriales bacterium]